MSGKNKNITDQLTIKQELFCQYMVNNSKTFDNATQAYAVAYEYNLSNLDDTKKIDSFKAYRICSTCGCQNLRKPKIIGRIAALLNELSTDHIVDSQLAFLILQNGNLKVKVAAIKEYNRLKGRISSKRETAVTYEIPIVKEAMTALNKAVEEYLETRC